VRKDRIVRERVTIAYRGADYEIGRGPNCYGIWTAGTPRSQPLQWWPETDEGWSAAWTRFTEIETPGTILPVGRRTVWIGSRTGADSPGTAPGGPVTAGTGRPAIGGAGGAIAALLLTLGVGIGLAGLFPGYIAGVSLTREPAELVPHVIYLAAWTASAILIASGGARLRPGALLGSGVSIVTFGLFLADVGTAVSGGAHLTGAGLVLSFVGWLVCTAGAAVALSVRPGVIPRSPGVFGTPRGAQVGAAVLVVLAGLGAAIAFAPSWDSFTLRTAAGQSQSLTEGNAFANAGPIIAGDVVVMVALAAVVIAAALWRPARHGAALLAGATVPMAAQAISALVQAGEPTSPAQFGISSAEAARVGLTISNGLTPVFWVYCAFVLALAVSCAWMLATPGEAAALGSVPPAGPADPFAPSARDGLGHPHIGEEDPQRHGAQSEDDLWHVAEEDPWQVTRAEPTAAVESPGTSEPAGNQPTGSAHPEPGQD
jgi:hypothetical protein